MNAQHWLDYFQKNCHNRPEPKWNCPSPLDRKTQQVLARSLSHFQLGETGGGSFLLSRARAQVPDNGAYHEALRLFVREENEHARLLERLVTHMGGEIVGRHWTHTLFQLGRRLLGLNFEIQTLVIAELVGTAYYRLLSVRTRDSVLDDTCALLLADEKQHLQFHADWLSENLSRLLPLERAAWRTLFQLLFAVAATVAWIDHRSALFVSGSNRKEFFGEARRECIRFLRHLESNANQLIPLAV